MNYKTLNEHLMAYHNRAGVGPVVVFINSLGSDQSIWDKVISASGSQAAALTYDLRGQGASEVTEGPYSIDMLADDLIALLDHLTLTQVILCGVSIGGMIAQAVCAKRPDLVRGAVLSNTAAQIGDSERWNTRIADVQSKGMAGIVDSILEAWFSADFQSRNQDEIAGHKRMLLRNDQNGYANTCAALRDADLTEKTRMIAVPCICISGGQDQSVPASLVQNLADLIAGSRVEHIADAGHLPCLDSATQVAGVVQALIDETGPQLDREAAGMAVRRSVLGDAHVDRAEANKTDFDQAFQSLITEGAWGTVWASDAISRRERSMITLALLAALGNFDEIPMHIRATSRTGASEADVQQAFQHVAIYAGVPRANQALKLAKQTYIEMKAEKDD